MSEDVNRKNVAAHAAPKEKVIENGTMIVIALTLVILSKMVLVQTFVF